MSSVGELRSDLHFKLLMESRKLTQSFVAKLKIPSSKFNWKLMKFFCFANWIDCGEKQSLEIELNRGCVSVHVRIFWENYLSSIPLNSVKRLEVVFVHKTLTGELSDCLLILLSTIQKIRSTSRSTSELFSELF